MELWGSHLYGNPCSDCSFDWSLTPYDALRQVDLLPAHFEDLTRGRQGTERHPDLAWNVTAYVSHVSDNLRNWAERLAGARLSGVHRVSGYDENLLAQARNYNEASLAGALWSLRWASEAWVSSVSDALAANIVLEHGTRGLQQAADVARNNAHDAAHHGWDIRRILTHTDQTRID